LIFVTCIIVAGVEQKQRQSEDFCEDIVTVHAVIVPAVIVIA
jgi:hypothetical protein